MKLQISARRWQDGVILLLGIWLVVSPWVFASPTTSPPALNAIIAGAIMAISAAFDLYKTYIWAVLLNIVIGAWVALSPWLVQAMTDRAMRTNLLVVGIATVVLGLWELRSDPELHQQWKGTGAAG
jgi:4-amino-4-deoxy-L-arabinose transferase-like glycosyltransferase